MAQPHMQPSSTVIELEAFPIGPPVPEGVHHLLQNLALNRSAVKMGYARNATHISLRIPVSRFKVWASPSPRHPGQQPVKMVLSQLSG